MEKITPYFIYTLNGLLAVLYWLAEHWAVLCGFLLACATGIWLDKPQYRDGNLDPRGQSSTTKQLTPLAVYLPSFALGASWLLVAWQTTFPLPHIGLAMWIGALCGPLALTFRRRKVLHRLRWFIGVYTLLIGAFEVLVRSPLTPQQAALWSQKLQAVGAGEALDMAFRSQFLPYILLLLWGVYPLTYFGYLAQQFYVQRRLLRAPGKSATAILQALRGRGEEVS